MKRFLERWPWLVVLLILTLILGFAASRLAVPHFDSDCPSGQVVMAGQCVQNTPTP